MNKAVSAWGFLGCITIIAFIILGLMGNAQYVVITLGFFFLILADIAYCIERQERIIQQLRELQIGLEAIRKKQFEGE